MPLKPSPAQLVLLSQSLAGLRDAPAFLRVSRGSLQRGLTVSLAWGPCICGFVCPSSISQGQLHSAGVTVPRPVGSASTVPGAGTEVWCTSRRRGRQAVLDREIGARNAGCPLWVQKDGGGRCARVPRPHRATCCSVGVSFIVCAEAQVQSPYWSGPTFPPAHHSLSFSWGPA